MNLFFFFISKDNILYIEWSTRGTYNTKRGHTNGSTVRHSYSEGEPSYGYNLHMNLHV